MNEILINPTTKKQLEQFIIKPSQAVIIFGPEGSGKSIFAKYLASKLLSLDNLEKLNNYPDFIWIKKPDDKQNILIDQIRELIKSIKLKVPGQDNVRRIIYIESAEDLNDQSANAILKILEEPSSETLYILSCNSLDELPATIVSRCQSLFVGLISETEAQNFLNQTYDEKLINASWKLSEGRAGLMLSLLKEDNQHPLKIGIDNAKQYIQKNVYQRLLTIDELLKNKEDLNSLFNGLSRVLAALHYSAINKGSETQAKKINNSRRLVEKLRTDLESSGSIRLILLRLSINLIR